MKHTCSHSEYHRDLHSKKNIKFLAHRQGGPGRLMAASLTSGSSTELPIRREGGKKVRQDQRGEDHTRLMARRQGVMTFFSVSRRGHNMEKVENYPN